MALFQKTNTENYMHCPGCTQELTYVDFYGTNLSLDSFGKVRPGFNKYGDIYKCENKNCDYFDEHFHTDKEGDLVEGYPCSN